MKDYKSPDHEWKYVARLKPGILNINPGAD
jgi:hypothetical protein